MVGIPPIGVLIFTRCVLQHLGILEKFLRDPLCYLGFPLNVRVSNTFVEGSKYKTDSDIKEVIILHIFTTVNFNILYDPSTPLWYFIDNSM